MNKTTKTSTFRFLFFFWHLSFVNRTTSKHAVIETVSILSLIYCNLCLSHTPGIAVGRDPWSKQGKFNEHTCQLRGAAAATLDMSFVPIRSVSVLPSPWTFFLLVQLWRLQSCVERCAHAERKHLFLSAGPHCLLIHKTHRTLFLQQPNEAERVRQQHSSQRKTIKVSGW